MINFIDLCFQESKVKQVGGSISPESKQGQMIIRCDFAPNFAKEFGIATIPGGLGGAI